MAVIISFISQKGGVGKTTSAINLATAFALGDYSVLLIDLDPQSSVGFSLGLQNVERLGSYNMMLQPKTPIDSLIYKTPEQENLHLILSGNQTLAETQQVQRLLQKKTPHYLKKLLENRVNGYDVVILDIPHTTSLLSINAICATDIAILPLQCEHLALESMKNFFVSFQELQSQVTTHDLKLAGVLLTMFDKDMVVHRTISRQLYSALSDAVFETVIPEHSDFPEASAVGCSILDYKPNSIGATAYIRFMKEICKRFSIQPSSNVGLRL